MLASLFVVLPAKPAIVFDARGLSWDERCTVEALQGLVNRAGPRLYLNLGYPWDEKWLEIYHQRNRITYERLTGMRNLLERFRHVVKGLVVYDPTVDGSRYVAITVAGIEDLLPVTGRLLSGRAPSLYVGEDWPGVDFATSSEEDLALWRRAAGAKLHLEPGKGLLERQSNPNPNEHWSFVTCGPITVDLRRYPVLEAEVIAMDGPQPSWSIKLTWDRNGDGRVSGPGDDLCLPAQASVGKRRWDIARLAGIRGRHTFAYIQLHALGKDAGILWRRVRFVSPAGNSPPLRPPVPLTSMGFELVRDMRGKFATSLQAYEWALREVMPKCNRRFAHAVNGTVEGIRAGCGPFAGFDWPVMNRGFIFNLTCAPDEMTSYGGSRVGGSAEQARMYRRILGALEPPAQITGYGEPEGYWCRLLSENGHYSFHFGDNWSFHARVPPRSRNLRQKRHFDADRVQVERDKFYVCFMTSEGDTMKGPIPFFYGSWFERERGSVPMNWGINPLMARYFPAMLEFYYDTATPNDYFFAGCSGAGYCYPDHMPNLEQFAEHTALACQTADVRCIDLWGARQRRTIARYASITRPLGLTINASPARLDFVADAIPVAYHELAYWQHAAAGRLDFPVAFAEPAKKRAAIDWLVRRIADIARCHYPPFIILVYSDLHGYAHHCALHREIAVSLDPKRFKPARLDEALAALRAWASDRVLIGMEGANERLAWACLEGVPTRVHLKVFNPTRARKRVQWHVRLGASIIRKQTLDVGARQARAIDMTILTTGRGADAPRQAKLTVRAAGREDTYPVALCVVPWRTQAREPELVGVWPAAALRHRSGQSVADAAAIWGLAWRTPVEGGERGHVVYGPYAQLPPGRYIVAFRLKLAEEARQDASVGTLEVFAGGAEGANRVVTARKLSARDFGEPGTYRWVVLEAEWSGPPNRMETRFFWPGEVPVVLDRVAVFRTEQGT